jgi:hypothetical protein
VLFHRRLYQRYGGFAEDMDQLEDWNLWTRYTLENDFVPVEKTTSKYRVPASAQEAAGRQALLDRAYHDALARQESMQLTLSPIAISRMAEAYVRSQSAPLVGAAASGGAAASAEAAARATGLEAELAASQSWMAKLEIDVATLNSELAQQVEETRRLASCTADCERLMACGVAGLEKELGASQAWVVKLEGDVAALNVELAQRVEETRRLADDKAAFDLLPELLRKLLLKRVFRARR